MTATITNLTVRKLSARLGAEITGLNLAGQLDAATVASIRAALTEHKALIFHCPNLDDAGQQRFASYFGPLTTAHPTVSSVEGAPNVLPVDSETGMRSNHWHTDATFVLNPPQITILRGLVIPPYGGETLIANTATAYQDLPTVLRDFADTLWAVHSNDYSYNVRHETLPQEDRERLAVHASSVFQTAHPVVRVHPLSGERGLFLGGLAQRIVGLSLEESPEILRLFGSYVTRPENVLRWSWAPGQLVMFDNRVTQHYAIDNYDDQPRRLHRVTVTGEVPVGVDGGRSYVIKGDAKPYTAPDAGSNTDRPVT
jgi:alpha-ketoglutarate-dependent taurine dioxygenase